VLTASRFYNFLPLTFALWCLADLPLVQEDWKGEEAGRLLLMALCENLRCGGQVLDQALHKFHTELGYKDLEFRQCVLQRNQLRKNFLLFSEELKGTKSWSRLKVRLWRIL